MFTKYLAEICLGYFDKQLSWKFKKIVADFDRQNGNISSLRGGMTRTRELVAPTLGCFGVLERKQRDTGDREINPQYAGDVRSWLPRVLVVHHKNTKKTKTVQTTWSQNNYQTAFGLRPSASLLFLRHLEKRLVGFSLATGCLWWSQVLAILYSANLVYQDSREVTVKPTIAH